MSRSSPQSVTWGHVRSLRPDHRCPPTTPASRLIRDPLSTPMEVAGVPKPRLEEAIDCVMNPHIGAPVTVVTSTSTSTTPASRRRAYSTCRISTLRRDVLCILVTRNMDNWGRVH